MDAIDKDCNKNMYGKDGEVKKATHVILFYLLFFLFLMLSFEKTTTLKNKLVAHIWDTH